MYNLFFLMIVLIFIYWLFNKLEEKKKLTIWVRVIVVACVWIIEAVVLVKFPL